jgi:hypothetical protein
MRHAVRRLTVDTGDAKVSHHSLACDEVQRRGRADGRLLLPETTD